jgi:hypothetical protein
MVVASNFVEVPNTTEASPSDTSLRSLDAVNLLLAGALSGFGPYVAVFLAEQKWTQQNIGFVLTAAGLAGLLTQLPAGGLLDAVRSKRNVVAVGAIMVAAGALIIAFWPSFPLVLAALVLQGIKKLPALSGCNSISSTPLRSVRSMRPLRPLRASAPMPSSSGTTHSSSAAACKLSAWQSATGFRRLIRTLNIRSICPATKS